MRIVSISSSVIDERRLITVFRSRGRFENFSVSLKQIFSSVFFHDRFNQISRKRAFEYFFQDIKTLSFFFFLSEEPNVFVYVCKRSQDRLHIRRSRRLFRKRSCQLFILKFVTVTLFPEFYFYFTPKESLR